MKRMGSVAPVVVSLLLQGCACGEPSEPDPIIGIGGALNDAWDLGRPTCTGTVTGGTFTSGGFSVAIADGVLSPCANANAPIARAQSLPPDLELRTGDVVVTGGGESFRFDLGEHGFHVVGAGAVVLRVPFDVSKVPIARRDPLHVFLRIHLPANHALIDVTGRLEGGVVVAEVRGLPSAVDVAVVFNGDLRAVSLAALRPAPKLTPTTWGAHTWCAVYNPDDPAVLDAVSQVLGVARPPSLAELDSIISSRIAASAVKAQTEYEAQGFRQPDLYIATDPSEPCGGTEPRFLLHFVQAGNKFNAFDPAEVIGSDDNHFGRLYVSDRALKWTMEANGATVLDVVAHELMHGIQAGYDFWGVSTIGYREGASTSYGHTIALGSSEAQVRSRNPDETWFFSNFLMFSTDAALSATYSNQDFFVYVARARNGGSLGYLTGLYQALHDRIEAAATSLPSLADQRALRWEPPRSVLLHAMDRSFKESLSTDLRTQYVEFLRERVVDHGPNGLFGRPGEPTTGFVWGLFAASSDPALNAQFIQTVDPETCTVQTPAFTLPAMAPLAARAVRFKPTTATPSKPVALHLTVDGDGAGTLFGGVAKLGAATQRLTDETIIEGFGRTLDPLDVAFANLDLDTRRGLTVRVKCEAMTDTSVPLTPWTLATHGFTIETSLTGPGLVVTSDVVPPASAGGSYWQVVEAKVASKVPADLKVALRVTPPTPREETHGGAHTTSRYTILGYEYVLKQPSEQPAKECGPTVNFTIDATTARQFTPQALLFEVTVTVRYRITHTTTWPNDDRPSTQTQDETFDALLLTVNVDAP